MNQHDQALKVQKEVALKKRSSSSDDDSDTDSKISSLIVLDAKTRQPYNAYLGVQKNVILRKMRGIRIIAQRL